jgi:hypothetical protein
MTLTSRAVVGLAALLAPWVAVAAEADKAPAAADKPAVTRPAAKPSTPVKKADPRKKGGPDVAEEAVPATREECSWIGKRIIGLLARDDVVAAGEFARFYAMFGCPERYLGDAFGCVVGNGKGGGEGVNNRIDRCWQHPSLRLLAEPEPQKPPSKPDIRPPEAGKK